MRSQVTLIDSLAMGTSACPEEILIFTCTVTGSQILAWSSNEYISSRGVQLEFSTSDERGKRINSTADPNTYAELISVNNVNGNFSLQSRLFIEANQSSVILCLGATRRNITFNVLYGIKLLLSVLSVIPGNITNTMP